MAEHKKIEIRVAGLTVEAILNESKSAQAVFSALPITGSVNTWGDEIYFSTSLNLPPEDPKEVVELGDIGYWQPGKAICLFFGLTPISTRDEIRPASPVNIIGKIIGDAKVLKKAKDGDKIEIYRAE
ncbi:hypothetical protein J7M23_04130 [Candidatus Sumerlaeota bacterium]|nr:hypothetical protein [Candidatus Sumerlaeota bacterium]